MASPLSYSSSTAATLPTPKTRDYSFVSSRAQQFVSPLRAHLNQNYEKIKAIRKRPPRPRSTSTSNITTII